MTIKQSKDYLNTLKNELDRGNNLIDYFTVIGLKSDIIFSDFLYRNDLKTLNLSDLIKPEIISKFPPFDKSTIRIDDNIIKHCFPNGYFLKESQTQPKIESFSFVLDNNFYSILYPQKFVSCLIFYESLEDYYNAYLKHQHFDDEMKDLFTVDELLKSKRRTKFSLKVEVNEETDREKERRSSTKYSYLNKENTSIFKDIYVPKCICFASLYPFFLEFNKILRTIYNFSKASRVKKPIEKIIESLVIEVPAPPRGIWKVEIELVNEKIELKQPPMNKLPLLNLELELIFLKFQIEQILQIYRHILIESRIIFFSKEISVLTPIIEGLLSLIFPLKFTFQHVTILPRENFMILESVTPYIVGINMPYEERFFEKNKIDLEDMSYLIVDIDSKKIQLKYPLKHPKYLKVQTISDEFPELPKHYKSKLIEKINDYIKEIKTNPKKKEDRDSFNKNMREFFFQFIVNILKDYGKFVNYDYYTNNDIGTPTIQTLYKVQEFLNFIGTNDRPFYKKLTETQMFVELIYKKMIPKDARDKIEILFLDEHIIEKKNRKLFSKKIPVAFLNSTAYDHRSVYPVSKPKISIDFLYFKKLENMKKALKYGQEIIWDNEEINISYLYFPELMFEVYFNPEKRNFIIPSVLSEGVDETNSDIVSRHCCNIGHIFNEMDNCIYLCWIQLWAMTFWYHDQKEKRYRFQQLLHVLDKVRNHEMETFNLLFDAVSKYGEDFMVFKLYERLITYRLNPNYLICTTIMRLLEKNNNKAGQNLDISQYIKNLDFRQEYNSVSFRKRSFKTENEKFVLTNEVNFYMEDSCVECQEFVNVNILSSNFKEMSREAEWALCPTCGRQFLPKIGVRLGIELNNTKNLKANTSIYENVVLFSPLFLKINYYNALIKDYQLKLDISSFRNTYSAFFWGSIWYFKIKKLDYEFLLPYENQIDLTPLKTSTSNLKIYINNSDKRAELDVEADIQKKLADSCSDTSKSSIFKESPATKSFETLKASKTFSIESQNSIIFGSFDKRSDYGNDFKFTNGSKTDLEGFQLDLANPDKEEIYMKIRQSSEMDLAVVDSASNFKLMPSSNPSDLFSYEDNKNKGEINSQLKHHQN